VSRAGAEGPPAWLPASVARAARAGPETPADLRSGSAWRALVEGLDRAAGRVGAADDDLAMAAGYRHLLVLLAIGIDEALRRADPADPVLRPGSTDAVLKWGMDCPDALYLGCPVRPDAVYRVTGSRGTVRYVGLQVMAGAASVANVVADDLALGPDGRIELTLAAEERPGNWLPLPPGASSLIVRQFFYDWEREEPARLAVERVSGGPDPREPGPLDPAAVARTLAALGTFVDASVAFWADVHAALRSRGVNRFHEPSARTELGGAAENVTVWGAYELEEDEALVIELPPPPALYWSVALGDPWWESIDYANHQSSLNGHQAVIDDDGIFRAVVARRDPGVANWLDPAGHRQGPMIVRYVRASETPVPETRVVAWDRVAEALPPGTRRVSPGERRLAIARRRAGVRRRFPR
jgi:hypothetical protein